MPLGWPFILLMRHAADIFSTPCLLMLPCHIFFFFFRAIIFAAAFIGAASLMPPQRCYAVS